MLNDGVLLEQTILSTSPAREDPKYVYVLVEGSSIMRCDIDNELCNNIHTIGKCCQDSSLTYLGLTSDNKTASISSSINKSKTMMETAR